MKHVQYLRKRKPASIDVSVTGSEYKRSNGKSQKKHGQTLSGSKFLSHTQNAADRIRNYWVYMLMVVVTGYAVVAKLKYSFEKKILATKEVLKILRVIFLAGRNMTPAQQQKFQSTGAAFVNHLSDGGFAERVLIQFKTIAPDLYAQIDIVCVNSETVVSALWPYTFSLWLPH